MAIQPTLFFVSETEAACRDLLIAEGHHPDRAGEISSYLAQSTDIAPELPAIDAACQARGFAFQAVDLDDADQALGEAEPATSLVWTVTDGIAYFRGGASPALTRLRGLPTLGSDDSLFGLCQDKFRSGAVLRALGLPTPPSGLARGERLMVTPPESALGYFVKPNRLGSKVGIWPDSHCQTLTEALAISTRIREAYRDDAVIQPYVPGRNIRTSFLDVTGASGMERLGIFRVKSGGDFQTMQDSLALYGETGIEAQRTGAYAEPALERLDATQPNADRAIRAHTEHLREALGLRDVFSMDWRVDDNNAVQLVEFEVCPGLPCFDFRAYCQAEWGLSLAEAIAETAASRFGISRRG